MLRGFFSSVLRSGSFLLFPLLISANQQAVSSQSSILPSHYQLINNMYNDGILLFVYPADDPNAKYLQQIASKLTSGAKGIALKIVSDKALSDEEAAQHALFLVGSRNNNRFIRKMLDKLPIDFRESGFQLNDQMYQNETFLKISLYPSPLNTHYPLILFCGTDEQKLPEYFNKQFGSQKLYSTLSSADFEIIENGTRKIMGFFTSKENENWTIDTSRLWIFNQKGIDLQQTAHFTFKGHQIQSKHRKDVQQLAELLENRLKSIEDFIGKTVQKNYIIHLYPNAETKGLMTGNTKPVHIGGGQEIYLVLSEEYKDYESPIPYQPIIEELLGKAKSELLNQGLAMWFTKHWQKKGYLYWAGRLNENHNYLILEELLDTEHRKTESPLIVSCLAGAMTNLLMDKLGKAAYLSLFIKGKRANFSARNYELVWSQYFQLLGNQTLQYGKPAYRVHSIQKGFNFAHEGYQVYNGYLSESATKSLQQLALIGANAAAVIPYTGVRSASEAMALPFADGPGTENDESIIHTLVQGHRAGLQIMLKPQIWLWSSWPGDIKMESEEEWNLWFDYYYRWIKHYALIAEIRHADVFCIGTELSATTLSHPDKWRELIQKIRAIYSGPLVYSANWGEEFENIRFWDKLDMAGISCYYPLSSSNDPSDDDLKNGARKIARTLAHISDKYSLPVLITEIGFRSIPAVWKEPWNHQQSANADFNAQARSYQAIISSFGDAPWCAGMYWWKWPAYMPHRINDQTGYTPINKPAEKLIKKWFKTRL